MNEKQLYEKHLEKVMGIKPIDDMSEAEINEILNNLLACLPNNGKLYKYRTFENSSFQNSYDSLDNGYLWMAKANTLNDDAEATVLFDPEKENNPC